MAQNMCQQQGADLCDGKTLCDKRMGVFEYDVWYPVLNNLPSGSTRGWMSTYTPQDATISANCGLHSKQKWPNKYNTDGINIDWDLDKSVASFKSTEIFCCIPNATDGGAIYASDTAIVSLIESDVSGNSASNHGGAVYINNGHFK